jgi:hypothetical protein
LANEKITSAAGMIRSSSALLCVVPEIKRRQRRRKLKVAEEMFGALRVLTKYPVKCVSFVSANYHLAAEINTHTFSAEAR